LFANVLRRRNATQRRRGDDSVFEGALRRNKLGIGFANSVGTIRRTRKRL